MFRRGRVRPSKGSSIIGMIGGLIFVLIGITTVIPTAGLFGVFWTLIAILIACFHAYNVFSEKGFSHYEVEVDVTDSYSENEKNFDEKFRQLKALKDDGLISEDEYEVKRKELLSDKW